MKKKEIKEEFHNKVEKVATGISKLLKDNGVRMFPVTTITDGVVRQEIRFAPKPSPIIKPADQIIPKK